MSRCVLLGAILSACLLAGMSATAQQPRTTVPFEGSHAFRHILKVNNLTSVRQIADLAQLDPRETLVVVFGDLAPITEVARHTGGLDNFRARGGALLIATDRRDGFPLGAREWGASRLGVLGLVVRGRGVRAVAARAYQNDERCPIVTDWAEPGHPIFRGLTTGIATNNPSSLRLLGQEPPLTALARFSPGCQEGRFDVSGEPFIAGTPHPPRPPVGGGQGGGGPGRVLVIAGHGTFMNGMMLRLDTDNIDFTCNCIRWLTEDGRRKHVLFIEEGLVMTNLDISWDRFPGLSPRVISLILRAAEKANIPNQLVLENVGRERILRWLLVGLTVLLAVYGLYRLVRAHHRGEPAPPAVAARVAQGEADVPVLFRRRVAVLAEGNYWEAARDLARQCFEGEGPRPEAPPKVLRGGRRLRRGIEWLWRLAYGKAEPVSARRLEALAALAIEVRAALADGSLSSASEPDAQARVPGS
ncbi:MAG: hypothetical protein L0Z62_26515 [Gemmataceae bacterium]|nr:hypothetical protein [Gemmataceae bacterium]